MSTDHPQCQLCGKYKHIVARCNHRFDITSKGAIPQMTHPWLRNPPTTTKYKHRLCLHSHLLKVMKLGSLIQKILIISAKTLIHSSMCSPTMDLIKWFLATVRKFLYLILVQRFFPPLSITFTQRKFFLSLILQ